MVSSYLQLSDRLSQAWLNRYTLVLLICLVKLIIFSKLVENSLERSESFILSNCETIDSYYSKFMAGTPYYLAKMGNFLIEKGIEESINGILNIISGLIFASEHVVEFMVSLWLGTYSCLIISAVDGAVDVATNTTEKLIGFVNSTVIDIANEIDDGLNDISIVINKIADATDKIKDFFSDHTHIYNDDFQTVNLTIDKLRQLHIPSSINTKLSDISHNIPDFETVKNKTDMLISIPFNKLRSEIKSINTHTIFAPNEQILYVPVIQNKTQGVCSSNIKEISDIYSHLNHGLNLTTLIISIMLIIIALIAIVPVIWSEYRLWRRLSALRDIHNYTDEKNDIILTYEKAFHKYKMAIGEWISCKFYNKTVNDKVKVQWFVSYIFSPRALTVLLIAMAGILICIFQYIILRVISIQLTSSETRKDAITFVHNLNSSLNQDLSRWVTTSNDYITNVQSKMNQKIFGWVQNTTITLNSTISTLVSDMNNVLSDSFNGTILYNPMKSVIGCVIENKLIKVEDGLTWLHKKMTFTLPKINETEIVSYLFQDNPSINTNVTNNEPIVPDLIYHLKSDVELILKRYRSVVTTELEISLGILLIWLVQIPIGIIIMRFKE